MLLALLGGLVVLGSASMWRGTAGDEPREPRNAVLAERANPRRQRWCRRREPCPQ